MTISDNQLKVFETVPDLYLILSPNLHILTASNAYLEATFTVREEIVGKHIFDAFPDNPATPLASAVANVEASLKIVLATGKPHRMALQRYDVPKPGTNGGFEEKYWQPIHTPVLDDHKNVLYIIQKVGDVSQQVKDNARIKALQAQQRHDRKQLEPQLNLLRMLLDQAPVGMGLYAGMDFVITSANPLICEMWGYTAEQVLGKPLLDAIPELKGQGFDVLLQNVLLTGIAYHGTEQAAQLLRNGRLETKYFNFSYLALKDESEAIIGILNVVIEVTEQVLARQQLEQSYEKVQSLNEKLATLNEELRTTNEELTEAKWALEKLNSELEERVQLRTKELKLAQRETERQRKLLHDLFMEAPVPIVVLDGEEMVFQLVNPTYQRSFPGRELLGKPMLEALPELAGTPIPALMEKVYRSGQTLEAQEMSLMMARSAASPLEEIYWTFTCQARRNQQGDINGLVVFAYEVTDHVKAHKKIEESEKALNHLANAMPQIVWIAETNGEVSFYNDRVSSLEGAHQRQDGTWNWQGVLFPEDEQPTIDAWKRAVAEGTIYEKEHRIRMKDGTYRWHLSRAYPQNDAKGNVVKWYGTATDVHVQKENAEALRQSEEQLRVALEGAELGTFSYYISEDKLIWSPKTKELMGLPPDAKVTFDTFLQANHPDDRSRSQAILQNALQPGSHGLYENEFRIIGITNGVSRWMRSKGRVIFDSKGNPSHFTGVTQDITQRKQAEKALKVQNEQLVQINNDLDNFIYTASHDLKAPISNIEALLQALLRTLPPESLVLERPKRITSMMQESVDRFKKTIANLTEVVKLQKENNGEAEMVDLLKVIKDVRLDLEQLIQSSAAQIEVAVADCQTIHFSEKNLRSVVYNLLSNAIKYREPARVPRVQISCTTTPDYQVLSVKDNGLGIDPGRIDQLFTMFKRFHSHVEGTGIGLYMVKKMVENASGKIEVETQQGEGTTFNVYFKY